MKRILVFLVAGIVILGLTACTRTIEFEPVTVDGFTVTVNNELLLTTDVFEVTLDADFELITHETDVDEFVDSTEIDVDVAETIVNDDVIELLAGLGIELPEIPEFPTIDVLLTLTDVAFHHYQNEELYFDFEDAILTVEAGVVSFEEITFYDAGTFVFEVSNGEIAHTIVVTVTEEVETETLVADIVHGDLVFENVLTIDLSDTVRETMIASAVMELAIEVSELVAHAIEIEELARIEAERIAEEERLAVEAAANRPQNNTNNVGSGSQGGGGTQTAGSFGGGNTNANRPTNVGGQPVDWNGFPLNYNGCAGFIVMSDIGMTSAVSKDAWNRAQPSWGGLMPDFYCGIVWDIIAELG